MCSCDKMEEMERYATEAEREIAKASLKRKSLADALRRIELMVNESVSGIRTPSIPEWCSVLAQSQKALEENDK